MQPGTKPTVNIVKKAFRSKDTSDLEIKNPPKPRRLWPPQDYLKAPGRRFYRRVGRCLLEADVLNELTRAGFEHACALYDRIHEMQGVIDREGAIVSDNRGSLKRHPAILIQQSAMAEFRALCNELGLTAISLNRLGVNLQVKVDKTAQFLFGED